MAWKKGVPRKGYITKSGKAHLLWGELVNKPIEGKQPEVTAKKSSTRRRYTKATRSVTTGELAPDATIEDKWKQWKSLIVHRSGPFVESCPQCGFPEADGGYCVSCGWSKVARVGRVS